MDSVVWPSIAAHLCLATTYYLRANANSMGFQTRATKYAMLFCPLQHALRPESKLIKNTKARTQPDQPTLFNRNGSYNKAEILFQLVAKIAKSCANKRFSLATATPIETTNKGQKN